MFPNVFSHKFWTNHQLILVALFHKNTFELDFSLGLLFDAAAYTRNGIAVERIRTIRFPFSIFQTLRSRLLSLASVQFSMLFVLDAIYWNLNSAPMSRWIFVVTTILTSKWNLPFLRLHRLKNNDSLNFALLVPMPIDCQVSWK